MGYVKPNGLCAVDLKEVLSARLLTFQDLVPDCFLADKCVGQVYDGAAVNRGRVDGLH